MGNSNVNTRPPEQMDDSQVRQGWYRQQGWWSGERLEARYQQAVLSQPHELAVADNRGHRFTRQQLWQRAGELAAELAAHGVKAGEPVVMYLPNWAEWQVVLLAVLRLRAVPAPIPVTTDAATLAYVMTLVGSPLLVAGESHCGKLLGATAAQALDEAGGGRALLVVAPEGDFKWRRDRDECCSVAQPIAGLDHINFTSSTTGRPKAVMHTVDSLAALNQAFTARFELGADQPIFMASPLGHSVGAYHGARLALYTAAPLILQDRWEPEAALQMIQQYQCAFTAAATPFLRDLVEQPWAADEPKLGSLRSFLCGGAPVPPVLLEQAKQQFPHTFVTNLWGMTEGGLVTCLPDSPHEKVVGTAGLGLPGLEMRILNSEGEVLPAGTEGELVMRGPGVFFGYLGQDDLYQSLMTPEGFFRTEDLAILDTDGYLQITGRLKDLIIRGGVNISPIPIEDVLARHPAVQSVAVIGLPDERLGERICAVVHSDAPKLPSLDQLVTFMRDQGCSKRNCPELLYCVSKMPRTAGGKIRKVDLKDIILSGNREFLVS